MRILIVNLMLHSSEHGLITRRRTNGHTMIYTLARGFVSLGHEVTLLASEEYRPLEPESPGFEVVWFPSVMKRVFSPVLIPMAKGLRGWLRRNESRFDLIISSEVFSMASLTASFVAPRKMLIWHEMSVFQKKMRELPARFWYNVPARLFMSRIPVAARSEEARRFISRFMKRVSPEIVSHGADERIFVPSEERKDTFVSVSQLITRKRIDRIIRRFADFVKRPGRESFILDIVGDGPERGNLEKLAADLGVAGSVRFHGFRFHSEWAPIAAGAVAMLIDTEQDLNMVTVSESIVNGTPVLMNTVPATAGYINASGTGIAREDWGVAEMEAMADNYANHFAACLRERPSLTNSGTAAALLRAAASAGIIPSAG